MFCYPSAILSTYYLLIILSLLFVIDFINSSTKKQNTAIYELFSRPHRTDSSATYIAWSEGTWAHWVLAVKAQYTQFSEENILQLYRLK